MKNIKLIIVFFLLLATTSVFSQGINGNGTNEWFYVPNSASLIDSSATGTYSSSGSQVFYSSGNTSIYQGEEGDGYLQTTWRKDFWISYPKIPDTMVVDIKFIGGENIIYLGFSINIQDSNSWNSSDNQIVNLSDTGWQKIKIDMNYQKTFMSNFGKVYLQFYAISEDSCYISNYVGVDNLGGIDDTLGVPIYDDFDGLSSISEIGEIPSIFILEQNYPNPFNPSTKIGYSISIQSSVEIKLFDLLGNEIETLVNEEKPAGSYEIDFTIAASRRLALTSGVYFYRLRVGDFIETKKMILMK